MSSELRPALSSRGTWAVRIVTALGVLAGSLALYGEPATAHGASDEFTLGSNYLVEIRSVPDVEGLQVAVSDLDGTIELQWSGSDTLVVLGYENEPYLRVGASGVATNTRSPAAYLNADRYAQVELPAAVDPGAPPVWTPATAAAIVRWHDHRTHWMSPSLPPMVADAPDRSHVVIDDWAIPLLVGGEAETITGALRWAPPPPLMAWLAVVVGVGLAGWTLLRTAWRHRHTLTAALAASVVIADGAAYWTASGSGMPVVFVTIALVATWRVARSDAQNGTVPLALAVVGFDALFIAGLDRVAVLQQRFVASAWPADLSRVVVAAGLGLGAAAVLHTVLGVVRGQDDAVPLRTRHRRSPAAGSRAG